MSEEWEDYYEILGVDAESNQEEIRKAYLELVKKEKNDNQDNKRAGI